jgi:hypothetical protein
MKFGAIWFIVLAAAVFAGAYFAWQYLKPKPDPLTAPGAAPVAAPAPPPPAAPAAPPT